MTDTTAVPVLATRRLTPSVAERLSRDYDARLNEDDQVMDADGLIAAAQGCRALIVTPTEKLDAAQIARLPDSVEIVATHSVGYDHIDLDAAKARGLKVTNTPDVLTDATADIALLLILAATRRAHEGERMVRENQWFGWAIDQLLGIQVTGKRLGILGMGRIGQAVARRARAFEMEIHYCNRRRLPPEEELGATFHADPEELLTVSQVLSLNSPATKELHHFLDARRLAMLPAGAVVVNTARGPLVDDDALIAALKSGHIAAAGLDVYTGEPNIHPGYRELENAFLLPHLGSATIETRDAMGFKCLNNLDAHFAGKPLPDPIA